MVTRLPDATVEETPEVEEPSVGISDIVSERLETEGGAGALRLAMPTTLLEYSPTLGAIKDTARTDGTLAAGLKAATSAPSLLADTAEAAFYYSGPGDIIDLISGIMGRDPVSGVKIDEATRWLSFAPFFIGGVGLTAGFHQHLAQVLRADEALGQPPGIRAVLRGDDFGRIRAADIDDPMAGRFPSHVEYSLRPDAFTKGRVGIVNAAVAGDPVLVAGELAASRRIQGPELEEAQIFRGAFVDALGRRLIEETPGGRLAAEAYATVDEASVRVAGFELYRVDRMLGDELLGDGFEDMIADYDAWLRGDLDGEGQTRLADQLVQFVGFVQGITDFDGELPPLVRWHKLRRTEAGGFAADVVVWTRPVEPQQFGSNKTIDWNSMVPLMVQQALDLYDHRHAIGDRWDVEAAKAARRKGESPKYSARQRIEAAPTWYTFVKEVLLDAQKNGKRPDVTLAAIMTAVAHMSNQAPWEGDSGTLSVAKALLTGADSLDEVAEAIGVNPAMFRSDVQRAIDVLNQGDIDPFSVPPDQLGLMSKTILDQAEDIRSGRGDELTSFKAVTGEKLRSFVWNLMRGDSTKDWAVTVDRHIANLLLGFYPDVNPSQSSHWLDNAYSAMASAIRIAALMRGFDSTDLDKMFRSFQAAVWEPWKFIFAENPSMEGPPLGYIYDTRILDVLQGRFDQPWQQWLLTAAEAGPVYDPAPIGKVAGLKKGAEAVISIGSDGTWRLFAPATDEYALNFRHMHATDHKVGDDLYAWAPAGPTVVSSVDDELDQILRSSTVEGKPGGTGASIYPGAPGFGPRSLPQYRAGRSVRIAGMVDADAAGAHRQFLEILDDWGVRYRHEYLPESSGIGTYWKSPDEAEAASILERLAVERPDIDPERARRTLEVLRGRDDLKTFDEEIAEALVPLIDELASGQQWQPSQRQSRWLPRGELTERKLSLVIYPETSTDWDQIWRVLWTPWREIRADEAYSVPPWFGEALDTLHAELGPNPDLTPHIGEVAEMYYWRIRRGRHERLPWMKDGDEKQRALRQLAKWKDDARAMATRVLEANPEYFIRDLALARHAKRKPNFLNGFRVLDMLYQESVADIAGYPLGQADVDAVDGILREMGWNREWKEGGRYRAESTVPMRPMWEMTVADPGGSVMTHITTEGDVTRPDMVRIIINGEYADYIDADLVENQHVRVGPRGKPGPDGGVLFGTELRIPADGAYGGSILRVDNPEHALDVHLEDPETGSLSRPERFALYVPDDPLNPQAAPARAPMIVFDGDDVVGWFMERGMSPTQVLVGDLKWSRDGSLRGAELYSPSDLQVWRGKAILRRTGVPDKVVRKMEYEPGVEA